VDLVGVGGRTCAALLGGVVICPTSGSPFQGMQRSDWQAFFAAQHATTNTRQSLRYLATVKARLARFSGARLSLPRIDQTIQKA